MNIHKVLVAGAGTMGQGIAQWFAQQEIAVELLDVDETFAHSASAKIYASWDRLQERGKFSQQQVASFKTRLKVVNSNTVCPEQDLLIEAIVENLAVKKKFFRTMQEKLVTSCIFASNTSSFPMTDLCGDLPAVRRAKFLGLHFFNPATIMKLVEVISGQWTPHQLAQDFIAWFTEQKKIPVLCKESPGFIVNRVARNFYGEALQIAHAEDREKFAQIDRVMEEVGGFPMGPFRLMDLIGIDVNYQVTQSVWHAFNDAPRFAPHPLQKTMVASAQLGKKTGVGFYRYD